MTLTFVALPSSRPSFAAGHNRTAQICRRRATPHANALDGALAPARCANAARLAKWLAADWANKKQALEDPQFWSHIHVVFRPLKWELMGGAYSFYSESAYDYLLGSPYKSAVYRIVQAPGDDANELELECYKVREDLKMEYWMGAHDGSILEPLTVDDLERMDEACNTLYRYDEAKGMYNGACRPGNKCVVRRAGRDAPAYVDSTLTLTADRYTAWDLGRDPETHERLWGTPAGPFDFVREKNLSHLVPAPEEASV